MYLVEVEPKRSAGYGGFSLYAFGDLHADRKDADHERLARWVDHIAHDPLAVAVFVGDALDGRIPGRRHFDPDSVRADFLEHLKNYAGYGLDVVERLLRPVVKAGVPLVCVAGNHDDMLEELGLTACLVQRLGRHAHYLGGEGFIRVRSGVRGEGQATGYLTAIYASHGHGGGRTPGPKVNAMQRTYEWVDADVVVAGHVHDGDIRVIPSYGVARKGPLALVRRTRVMYRAPSFVRRAIPGTVGYQGRMGYPSTDEGLQWVRIDPGRGNATRYELEVAP